MSDRIMAVAERPRSLEAMIGFQREVEAVRKHGSKPRAWLLEGPAGTGKTTLARIIAASLQAEDGQFGTPGDLYDDLSSHDVTEINASDTNGVDDVRTLVGKGGYMPLPPSKRKVFILDEAQELSRQAQNVLLKPFEDSGASTTVWIICTTNPVKIIEPLRDRCIRVKMPLLREAGVKALVKRSGKVAGSKKKDLAELVDELIDAGVRSPRKVVQAVERFAAHGDARAAATQTAAGVDSAVSIEIARAVVGGNWSKLGPMLKGLPIEETDGALRTTMGYLRTMLLGANKQNRQADTCAYGLAKLSGILFLHEQEKAPAMVGILYELATRFGARR